MELTEDRLYSEVQAIFRRGLVIIVGSGASCAWGLPSMTALAKHLVDTIPDRIAAEGLMCQSEWAAVSTKLQVNIDLESALTDLVISDSLADIIADEIAACILDAEQTAISKILSDDSVSSFGRLFSHILQASPVANVITTNYDRLLEVHAARAGVRVDSMFYGHTIGRLDPVQSREELFRSDTVPGRMRVPNLSPRPHVRLSKPHGSLDWFTHGGQHYRSDLPLPGSRRIVAPGGNKYRRGYETPFDAQRERANDAIDTAAALLFIGYGFNDDHLQTHLLERIPQVPTVVLSRSITERAREHLLLNVSAIGIEAAEGDDTRSRITKATEEIFLDLPIWELEHLVKEVLRK